MDQIIPSPGYNNTRSEERSLQSVGERPNNDVVLYPGLGITVALIVASGTSQRMNLDVPKQYIKLGNGKAALAISVEKFLKLKEIDYVAVVINSEHMDFYNNLNLSHPKLLPVCFGGKERHDSVKNGLDLLKEYMPTKVLVHDAVRPFVEEQVILDVIHKLEDYKAVIPAVPVQDTIKEISNNEIVKTVPRDNLVSVQTPQGFDFNILYDAHQNNNSDIIPSPGYNNTRSEERSLQIVGERSNNDVGLYAGFGITDDAMLMEAMGHKVAYVKSSARNFKITTMEDLAMANLITSNTEYRVGIGYDLHRLREPEEGEEKFVMLGGVKIPHYKKVEAHSDGDVVLHALTDAILGSIAAGDIGIHFPPSDPKWANAASYLFVEHAIKLLHEKGGKINNIDINIITERPKISPVRDQIIENISKITGIDKERISLKAKTAEKLGPVGEELAIEAEVIISVTLCNKY